MRFHLPRRALVLPLLAVMLCAPVVVQRVAVSADGPTVTVVGDSITANYNDQEGDDLEGWWSMVGRRYGAEVTTYAESGSGYLRPGGLCDGSRFIDRPLALMSGSPDVMIIEGGRNDWADCEGERYWRAADPDVRSAVDEYLDVVASSLGSATRVIVLGPVWGPKDSRHEERIRAIIESSADSHDMEFIDTRGVLPAEHVMDGTHPNRRGSAALARRVIDGIGPTLIAE